MTNTCFYCGDNIPENHSHIVNMILNLTEREEPLCSDCYAEWLEGIKE